MLEYILFFVGLVILGDVMLIPLIYFAVTNSLSLPSVLLVGFLAAIAADCMWYWIGTTFNKEKVSKFFKLNKLRDKFPEIFEGFVKRADKILFISKFLYGIRVPVRVLYGLEELPFKNFLKLNILGSLTWLILISGLAYTLDVSAEELRLYVRKGEVAFLIFFFIVLLFEIIANRYTKKLLKSKD